MASTLSAFPIRLGNGALRHPAWHTSGLHIARQVKPHVINMAVNKRLFTKSSRSLRMEMVSHRPKFVSKGRTISMWRLVIYSFGIFVAFLEGIYHFLSPIDQEMPAELPAEKTPSCGWWNASRSASKAPPNRPSWTVSVLSGLQP